MHVQDVFLQVMLFLLVYLLFTNQGGLEFYKFERLMFSRGHDELGAFVRFCERSSKNYKVDIMHFQLEGDKNLLYLILQPINSPRTQVWYNRNRDSVKVLSNIVKCIGERTGVGGNFSNKSLRSTCVTQMSLGQVPREVDCVVSFVGEDAAVCNGSDGGGLIDSVSKATSSGGAAIVVSASNGCGSTSGGEALVANFGSSDRACASTGGGVVVNSCTGGGNSKASSSARPSSNIGIAGSDGSTISDATRVIGSGSNVTVGVLFIQYKLGDDIPFDENVLHELPAESTRAMGVGGRAAISMYPMCNMSNCNVNVYVGKENIPFETLDK
ncbi:hypothetical protein L7F22_069285 [Adiantum nelumboides]|nr:hypothetical protein [Adiantum nelumboides]